MQDRQEALLGQQLGHYRLLRMLGRGAFATVYLGKHQYLERLAAIKVLHVRIGPASQESFRREARTIAQLDHPHIISVHEFGIEDQIPYLVMEYMQGGTLRERYPKGTRLSFEQIVTYVKQIASALDYAHQQRVIHRDIKPENLLINSKQEIVLSDFGIAVVESTLDSLSTQSPAGTPLYMAPEQAEGKSCAASDQYALGVMIYEWLCGEPPFRGPLFEILNQHQHKPPPSLCARVKVLPPAVEDAVFGALAKDPGQRFSSVTDLATVLSDAFAATTTLSLHGSGSHRPQDQIISSAPVLSSSGQGHSDTAIQSTDLKAFQLQPLSTIKPQQNKHLLSSDSGSIQSNQYAQLGRGIPATNLRAMQAVPQGQRGSRWPFISLLCIILLFLVTLLPFMLVPNFLNRLGFGGTSPAPTSIVTLPIQTATPTLVPTATPTSAPAPVPAAPTPTPIPISSVPTPTPVLTPTPTATTSTLASQCPPTIQKGSQGSWVKTLQQDLNTQGWRDQDGEALLVDGDFGSKTEYAVKSFQEKNAPPVDGIVGPVTWAALGHC
jgi:serine/threonine protein kinase